MTTNTHTQPQPPGQAEKHPRGPGGRSLPSPCAAAPEPGGDTAMRPSGTAPSSSSPPAAGDAPGRVFPAQPSSSRLTVAFPPPRSISLRDASTRADPASAPLFLHIKKTQFRSNPLARRNPSVSGRSAPSHALHSFELPGKF